MKFRDILSSCTFIFLFLTLSAIGLSAQTVIEDIVARVNDAIITRSDLQRSRDQVQSELKQQSPANAERWRSPFCRETVPLAPTPYTVHPASHRACVWLAAESRCTYAGSLVKAGMDCGSSKGRE